MKYPELQLWFGGSSTCCMPSRLIGSFALGWVAPGLMLQLHPFSCSDFWYPELRTTKFSASNASSLSFQHPFIPVFIPGPVSLPVSLCSTDSSLPPKPKKSRISCLVSQTLSLFHLNTLYIISISRLIPQLHLAAPAGVVITSSRLAQHWLLGHIGGGSRAELFGP